MNQQFAKEIRPLLDDFYKIENILQKEEIELPKIVVVGDQSSGKSSVLQAITNFNFPIGQNLVTKRPIILQSRNSKNGEEYGSVGNGDDFTKDENGNISQFHLSLFSEGGIVNVQNNLFSNNDGISEKPFNIKIIKNNSPDLTIIDLPGITYKNKPVTDKIRNMIKTYTKGKDTLIIFIVAANTDFTTSEALLLIKEYNKDYHQRTIGVITKVDLAYQDKGFCDKILSNDLELKNDLFIVRNRTQEEIDNNLSLESSLEKEKAFFKNKVELRLIDDSFKGIENLTLKIIEIQKEMLTNAVPRLKDELNSKICFCNKKIKKLPIKIKNDSSKIEILRKCFKNFTKKYVNCCSGNNIIEEDMELNIEARMREYFDILHNDNLFKVRGKFFSDEYCYITINSIYSVLQ